MIKADQANQSPGIYHLGPKQAPNAERGKMRVFLVTGANKASQYLEKEFKCCDAGSGPSCCAGNANCGARHYGGVGVPEPGQGGDRRPSAGD